ncbi:XrtA/PEP-CTERM system histidine kinase PrsK [Permianibacter aggregans]|uniref:histidine kinase n=1 Tax=Permianibacter aggregans TaxID=1510150 RepID=A0A4R6UPF7_9GAMM|nr:XrtA/PEP-CTERM system histidine kinase PrsK [Permianibacter aggregans]QGX40095.1 PEP-CTERM system histidine kinase PrsK [Permianibacter aggregans]TDQ49090.1 putative PEP-CTERM system histidine kinase [Permianibacter aggregans]
MNSFALVGYALATVGFATLLVLLLSRWRGRLASRWLVTAMALQVAWGIGAVLFHTVREPWIVWLYSWLEALRYFGWLMLMRDLWQPLANLHSDALRWYSRLMPIALGATALMVLVAFWPPFAEWLGANRGVPIFQGGMMALALTGGLLTEMLYRRTRPEQRWAIKFLCLGLASVFIFDFYLYADALLFHVIDPSILAARGYVTAASVPLLAVAISRNPRWSIDLFISRRLVLRSVSLLAAGCYLLLMAAVGFYIRATNAEFGDALRLVFVAFAVLVGLVIAFSGQVRARIKVLINKHFFSYQYDYREEWLKLNRTLAGEEGEGQLHERAIRALAEIVDSPAGMIWTLHDGRCEFTEHWSMPPERVKLPAPDRNLIEYLSETGWVIEIPEYKATPEHYGDLQLNEAWLKREEPWLIVPLMREQVLTGVVLLAKPRAPRTVNWEVRDLLKTAAAQVASYIAVYQTTLALVDARQFEAFNRLSAFVVHDLKNVAAQLQLIVANAEKHRHKPAFVDDAFGTVANAVGKLERMLTGLRKGSVEASSTTIVEVMPIIEDAIKQTTQRQPVPTVINGQNLYVRSDKERLTSVLVHLIHNAQEACDADGQIVLDVSSEANDVLIKISDNGHGMDATFIRERLFRPFDTTKGNAGMGIGAFQARETIRSFGGDLTVTSAPKQGTEFSIRLARVNNMDENDGKQ